MHPVLKGILIFVGAVISLRIVANIALLGVDAIDSMLRRRAEAKARAETGSRAPVGARTVPIRAGLLRQMNPALVPVIERDQGRTIPDDELLYLVTRDETVLGVSAAEPGHPLTGKLGDDHEYLAYYELTKDAA